MCVGVCMCLCVVVVVVVIVVAADSVQHSLEKLSLILSSKITPDLSFLLLINKVSIC